MNKNSFEDYRCPNCNKLFFKGKISYGTIEIKCKSCKSIILIKGENCKVAILLENQELSDKKLNLSKDHLNCDKYIKNGNCPQCKALEDVEECKIT